MRQIQFKNKALGFSLVEMAVVLVILGFVLGALLLPLQAQRSQTFQLQTENTLEQAKRALLGYAISHGRLPCPATATSNIDAGSFGQENPIGGTHNIAPPALTAPSCATQAGFLPAATLGLQPVDANGFALDAWNNRIRYAVTADDSSGFAVPRNSSPLVNVDASHPACGGDTAPDFTTSGNISAVGLACLGPNLRVCSSAAGITSTSCSVTNPESNYLINNAVAVIYSLGTTGSQSSGGADENANLDNNAVLVSHDVRNNDANGEFDHMVIWISPYILYNVMIEAGQLH